MEVARLQVAFEAKGQDAVQRAVKQTDRDIEGMGTKSVGVADRVGRSFANAGNLIKVAFGAVIVKQIADVGKSFVSAASDWNESVSKSEVIFGRFSAGVVDWANQSASALGTNKQNALETAATFGNLFKGMGVGQREAAGMSQDIVQLAADLASFNNVPVDEVLENLRSGLVGEAEPLRKYGILLDEATVAQKAMEMTGKANAKQLTQQEKLLARNALIFEQTTTAQGDFARTSRGLANQMRILRAQFDNVRITLGSFLLPLVLTAVSFFNQFFDRITRLTSQGINPFDAAMRALHTSINQIFGRTAGNAIYQTINLITDAFELLFAVLSGGDLGAVFDEIRFDAGKLLEAFRVAGAAAWDALVGAVRAAAEIAGGIPIGDVAITVGSWVFNQAENLYNKLSRWVFGLVGGRESVGDGTGGPEPGGAGIPIGTLAVAIGGWAVGLADGARTLAEAVSLRIGKWLLTLANDLMPSAKSIKNYAINIASWVVDKAETAVSLAQAVGVKVSSWILSLKDDVVDAGKTIKGYAVNIGGWVVDKAANAVTLAQAVAVKVGSWILALKNAAESEIPKITNYAVNVASIAVKDIAGWASDAITTIQTWIDDHPADSVIAAVKISDFKPLFDDIEQGNWKQVVRDFIEADPVQVTPVLELAIQTSVENAVRDLGTGVVPDWTGLIGWLGYGPLGMLTALTAWGAKVLTPDLAKIFRGAFTGAIKGAFDPRTIWEEVGPFGEVVPVTQPGLSESLWTDLFGWITDLVARAEETLSGIDLYAGAKAWIGEQIASFTGWIDGLDPPDLPKWLINPIGWIEDQITGGDGGGMRSGDAPIGGGGMLTQKRGGGIRAIIDSYTGGEEGGGFAFPTIDTSAFETSIARVPDATTKATTATTRALTELVAAGRMLFDQFRANATSATNATNAAVTAGFAAMRANAVAQASALVAGVIGQLSRLPSFGFGIGQSLGFGIASGISSTIGAVAASAANLVNQAVAAARNAAQISSPSRVMMQLGGYMAEGFALGIDRNAPLASRSLAHLVRAPAVGRFGASALGGRGGVTHVYALRAADYSRVLAAARMAERGGNVPAGVATWQRGEV